MRVIVTRPQAQARGWVNELKASGVDAVALPLIDIAPVADASAVVRAWNDLSSCDFVMFVSANAVAQFFALAPPGAAWPAALRAGATGPGTQAALQALGLAPAQVVAPAQDASQFDSEALWSCIAHESWLGRRVLVVRGEAGRDWLAQRWQTSGAHLSFVAAYRRLAPRWDAEREQLLGQALAAPGQHLWLFSSSEGIGHLRDHAEGSDWSQSGALATHARIAQVAREAGFARVEQVAPQLAAVVMTLRQRG